MADIARVVHMHKCNWKPATQYWRELYLKSQEQIAELKQRIQELEK